ncbi:MAG: helix-turn-helix domain-containing protein [Lutibacter sp.]
MHNLILTPISVEDLTEKIALKTIELLEQKKQSPTHDPDILLTRAEACKFLKIEQTTLYHWQKAGKIKMYGIGNRRFLKKAELMECLILKK